MVQCYVINRCVYIYYNYIIRGMLLGYNLCMCDVLYTHGPGHVNDPPTDTYHMCNIQYRLAQLRSVFLILCCKLLYMYALHGKVCHLGVRFIPVTGDYVYTFPDRALNIIRSHKKRKRKSALHISNCNSVFYGLYVALYL